MLGREIVEGQQAVPILGQAVHGLGVLRLIACQGPVQSLMSRLTCLGHPDIVQVYKSGQGGMAH